MKRSESLVIYVFADWLGLDNHLLMGVLNVDNVRGKEIFSFEYNRNWLNDQHAFILDPNLQLFLGKQYPDENKPNFGLFLDSSPDRWGRLLMRRREALQAKTEKRKEKTLGESDYLLGVHDEQRIGGLRFKTSIEGPFLDSNKGLSAPPFTSLRDLEYASLQIERDDSIFDPQYSKWLFMLLKPGSSLGGARPKSGVSDQKKDLWIAKFPSASDEKDSGAWEFVLNKLAAQCGIIVPEAQIVKLSGNHHTYLVKRFDRTTEGKRIHFASAMTLLGYNDGSGSSDGISYLELAAFVVQHGDVEDLEQLWRRIVFNVLVSNTDDHLRNHGFLLTSQGWKLSPAYDMNPNEYGRGLSLNITENSNELDLSLTIDIARYFRLKPEVANKILKDMIRAVSNWRSVAKEAKIPAGEIERVKNAFHS